MEGHRMPDIPSPDPASLQATPPEQKPTETSVDWLRWLDERMRTEISKVDERVEKHTQFVKDSLLLTFRLVAGGVVIVVALLTLIGLKNWFDVTDRLKNELNDRYARTEKEYIEKISDRALVASYALQKAAEKRGILNNIPTMSVIQLQKVLDVLSNPDTEIPFFNLCTNLLTSSAGDINASAVDNTIAGLVKAQDKSSWIRRQPKKWSQIISIASERGIEDVKPFIQKYVSDGDIPGEVRISAIEFAVKVNLNNDEMLKALQTVYRDKNPELKAMALFAIITLDPSSGEYQKKLKEIATQSEEGIVATLEAIGKGAMAREVYEVFDDDDLNDKYFDIAAQSIEAVTSKGVKLVLARDKEEPYTRIKQGGLDRRLVMYAVFPERGNRGRPPYRLPVPYGEFLLGDDIVTKMLKHGFERNDVMGFSNRGMDIMEAFSSAAFEIHAYFSKDDGFFQIADGTQIWQGQQPTLQFKREGKDAKTVISWRAIDDGPTKTAEVTKISNIDNLRLLFMKNKDEPDTFADLRRRSP
jgi:hypothetical protein